MYKLKSISCRAIIASLALFGIFAIYGSDNDIFENISMRNLEEKKPLGVCNNWCLPHTDPWDIKCTYEHCKGCSECFDQDIMRTPRKEDGTPLKIDLYGGSISVGFDVLDYKSKQYSALVEKTLGVQTSNNAIPAAGVSQHLLCGIAPADIIISSLELTSSTLQMLMTGMDFLLSVPSISSYLIYGLDSATLEAYNRLQDKSKFSVINLSEQDKNIWPCLNPSFYNYTTPNPFTGTYIPKDCYTFAEGEDCTSETAQQAVADRTGTEKMKTLRSSCDTPNPTLTGSHHIISM